MSDHCPHPVFNFSRIPRGVRINDLEDAALAAVIAQSMESGGEPYPCYRFDAAALLCPRDEIFDRMGQRAEWRAWATDPITLVLRSVDAVASFRATGNEQRCMVSIRVWAIGPDAAEALLAVFREEVSRHRVQLPQFSMDWRFMTSNGLQRMSSVEELDDVLLDEAYPCLSGGVGAFIAQFLDSRASVLLLQGPPGTGKTRLVRGILKAMAGRKPKGARLRLSVGD